MFITAAEVMEVTPYTDVTNEEVRMAQLIVEVFTGRVESEVDGARDKGILSRAVALQTVYMRKNPEITFEQIGVSTIQTGGETTVFRDSYSPFIAPMVIIACRELSWKRSRSVKFGRIFQRHQRTPWERD